MILSCLRRNRMALSATLLLGLIASSVAGHPDYKAKSRHKVKVKIYGELESVDGNRWVVAGYKVRMTTSTSFEDAVAVGDYVKVKGFEDGDNNWVMKKVELEDRSADGESSLEIKLTGRVQSMRDNKWIIAGRVFLITDDTEFEGDMSVGDRVKIEADIDEAGNWIASEVDQKN